MKYLFTYLFVLFSVTAFSQKKVELKNADQLEYDETINKEANRLIGNVIFEHNGAFLYCDSAYFYQQKNSLEAFGKVKIVQGKELTITCNYMEYVGDSSIAKLRGNIVLKDKKSTLTTNILDYNTKEQIGSYHDWGKIKDAKNNLISKHGYYYSETKTFYFKEKVRLQNKSYLMVSDTLQYNTDNEIAYFFGHAIITSEKDTINCQSGWYDTKSDKSEFKQQAIIKSKEQTLAGNSLFFDRKQGYGKAIKNVEIFQRADKIWIFGGFGEFFQKKDSSIMTKKPMMVQLIENDTFYLRSDTITAFLKVDKKTKDTLRYTKAYNHVQFFKSDMQGKCDSIRFSYKDSLIQVLGSPIIWNNENQMTADSIHILTGAKKLKELRMFNNAFIISQADSVRFNQIKGKNMKGYFNTENKLSKVLVQGNGESIYYGKDKEEYLGVNKVICSDIMIYLASKKVDKITFITKPDATMYPMNELKSDELILKNFKWYENERPSKNYFLGNN